MARTASLLTPGVRRWRSRMGSGTKPAASISAAAGPAAAFAGAGSERKHAHPGYLHLTQQPLQRIRPPSEKARLSPPRGGAWRRMRAISLLMVTFCRCVMITGKPGCKVEGKVVTRHGRRPATAARCARWWAWWWDFARFRDIPNQASRHEKRRSRHSTGLAEQQHGTVNQFLFGQPQAVGCHAGASATTAAITAGSSATVKCERHRSVCQACVRRRMFVHARRCGRKNKGREHAYYATIERPGPISQARPHTAAYRRAP